MPETDILNPTPGFDPELGDTMNPNFGFTRKRPLTRLNKKAPGGGPYTRETSNGGHQHTLSWIGRTWKCAQLLKWYGEQYEDGYFTIIDWDNGGRHYVGRFETEVAPVETTNGKWDVQNVTFTEIPLVPMVQYPADWENDAIDLLVKNDFGDQKLSTQGTWAFGTHMTLTTMDNPGNLGEWAQHEYKGYGFRLHLLMGPEYGQVSVYLDGVQQGGTIDLYAAQELGPQVVATVAAVPLGIHRVMVIASGNKNALASAAGVSWYKLEVMR